MGCLWKSQMKQRIFGPPLTTDIAWKGQILNITATLCSATKGPLFSEIACVLHGDNKSRLLHGAFNASSLLGAPETPGPVLVEEEMEDQASRGQQAHQAELCCWNGALCSLTALTRTDLVLSHQAKPRLASVN